MERPVEGVLVVNDTGGITANTTTLAAFLASGTVGELAIFNADTNTAVGTAAALPTRHYYAVKVSATELRKSPTFNSAPTYLAAIDADAGAVGSATISSFNGDCETEYIIKVRLESEKIFQSYGYQDLVKTYSYVSRCCGSACGCPEGAAWDVAMGIAENINADKENALFTLNPNEFLIGLALPINSAAVTATNDFDDNVTIVKGSNEMTTAGGWDHSDTGTYDGTLVAGDFVRISDEDGTAPTTADPIYRVESVSGDTAVLDRPVEMPGRTGTGASSTDFEVITKAVGEAFADSSWSISIAGGRHATPAVGAMSPIANVVNSQFVSLNIGLLGGFDCNGTVSTAAPTMPFGQDWQVSQMELKNSKNAIGAGNRPSPYRTPFPLSQLGANESLTVSGEDYRVLSISYADQHTSAATAGAVRSPYVVRLAINDDASTTYDNVVAVFGNGWNGISINSDGVIPVL